MSYAPVYYNPGIAQTVTNMTGPPLIMPAAGGQPQGTLYASYPNQTHMYTTTTGSDIEQTHEVAITPVELSDAPVQISPPQPTVISENKNYTGNSKSNTINEDDTTTLIVPLNSGNESQVIPEEEVRVKYQEETIVLPKIEIIQNDSVPMPKEAVSVRPTLDLKAGGLTGGKVVYSSIKTEPSQSAIKFSIKKSITSENLGSDHKHCMKSANGPILSTNATWLQEHTCLAISTDKVKYGADVPDFPELGQSSGCGPTSTKSIVANKERSWASIASSKTGNGPMNGIVVVSADNGGSGQIVSTASYDNYDGCQYNPQSPASISSSLKIEPSAYLESSPDKAMLSDENDQIALQLGEFLSNYSLDHHSLSLTPRGLSNQNNFCYINATLQSLIACPPFVNLFRSLRDVIGKRPCKATPITQSMFNFVMEFDPITRISQGNKHRRPNDAFYVGANFEAAGIRRVLGLLDGATFKVEGRQEDAEEFLSHLLNGLHDEMIKVIKWVENKKDRMNPKDNINIPIGQPQPTLPTMNGERSDVKADEDDDQWQVMGPKNKGCTTRKTCLSKSPISEMFVGQMCSALNRTIGLKSTTLQPFFTLQLDIQEDNIHSVRDALEGLSAKEEVTGFTSGSGQETEAWKQLSLEVLPIILILHMKRFVYDKSGNKIYKLDKKVDFPVDLEIGRELLSINSKGKYTLKQRQYKLFAAVYHDGEEAHKGHYIADCFHPSGGSLWGQFGWIRYDDTAVKGIAENLILNPQPPRVPYLLYYRRVDTLSQTKKERL